MHNATSPPLSTTQATGVTVFWSVNGVIFGLTILLILWCLCSTSVSQTRFLPCIRERQETQQPNQQQLQQQQQAVRELQDKSQRNKDTPEQRRQKLEECFQKHNTVMTVTEEDLVEESLIESLGLESMEQGKLNNTFGGIDSEETTSTEMATGDGFLVLKRETQESIVVQNCCAVCLSRYEVGDEVVWSPNSACQHAFHKECILEWLVKMYKQRRLQAAECNPCPCCRQEFATLDSPPDASES